MEHSAPQLRSLFLEPRLARMVGVALFALSLYLVALSLNAFKTFTIIGDDIPPQAVFTVSGEGEVTAVPDTATFSFGVVAEASDAATAQGEMTKRLNTIMTQLRSEFGFTDEELTTTSYNLQPRYEWKTESHAPCTPAFCPPSEGKRELVGFEAHTSVQVKTQDFDKARKALGSLASLGATDISSLSFTVKDPQVLEAQAREKAIAQARQEAVAVARALGVSLGRVVSYTEGGWGGPVPFARAEAVKVQDEGPVEPDISPGETTIRKQVSITYELY